jgi:cell division septum initiation protein DivIVA
MTTLEVREPPNDGRGSQLSPAAIRRMTFPRAPLGRRGLLESEVDRFRIRVADELSRSDQVKAELRAENETLRREVQRLHDYFRDQRIDAVLLGPDLSTGTGAGRGAEVGAGNRLALGGRVTTTVVVDPYAVNMLSVAQQAADQHIAQAEHFARQLIGDARRQYEEILVTAERQAGEAAEAASQLYQQVTAPQARRMEQEELLSKVAYLRTFATVTQVQMRSILDALRGELDQLCVLSAGPGPAPGTGPGIELVAGPEPEGPPEVE